MKKFLLLAVSALIFNVYYAQSDSTIVSGVKVIDIVKLKDGTLLKGEILVFEEKDGDITFKSLAGRTYFLTKDDYLYFEEDQILQEKPKKKNAPLRERKEDDFEFSFGLAISHFGFKVNLVEDEYYLNDYGVLPESPVSLKANVGKYLNRKTFIGGTAELAILLESKNYFNAGVRLTHQLDGYKNNRVFYVPIELTFNQYSQTKDYEVNETFLVSGYTSNDLSIKSNYSSVQFAVGTGIAFVLPEKKSIGLEISLITNKFLSSSFSGLDRSSPNIEPSLVGARFCVLYSL